MQHLVVALASAGALISSGSAAASLLPVPSAGVPSSVTASLLPDRPEVDVAPAAGPELPGDLRSLLDRVLESFGAGSDPEPVAGEDDVVPDQKAPKAASSPFPTLPTGAYAGYGTGTVYSSNRPVDTEISFSGAAWASLPVPARANELGRSISPALAAGSGFGRGSAVEIDVEALSDLDDNADAKAPPNRDVVTKQVTDADLSPVLDADVLNSKAYARSATSGCVVGPDLAFGSASATGSDLFENGEAESLIAASARGPVREVAQSVSRTRLLAPVDPSSGFGLLAETRQTIAPITLFKGQSGEFTIELLGEWVLQVTADGTSGSVTYGPEKASPKTPVLRITRPGDDDQRIITFQQFTEKQGLVRRIGSAEVAIGEDPRAIGGNAESEPAATGTLAAAAVDVVRVSRPDAAFPVQLRLGHMEAAVAVPPGGISCPGIGMAKQSDPVSVTPGQRFTWTVTATNPNDCKLDELEVVDAITATPGMRYRIVSTSPGADVDGSVLTFRAFGPLQLGQSAVVRIEVEVDEDSPPGRFTDEARARGMCGPLSVGGAAETTTGVGAAAPQPVPREGSVTLTAPEVRPAAIVAAGPVTPAVPLPAPAPGTAASPAAKVSSQVTAGGRAGGAGQLPRTGGIAGILLALSLLGSGSVLRRLKRRR